ncbi:MAG: DNA-processing protein DprA [Nitrospirota bacterium]|nr:DNA-processing protein DprA [Nitrospirota bacterium]
MPVPADLRSWLALRAIDGLGDAAVCRLVQAFGSAEAACRAPVEALVESGGVRRSVAEAIGRGPDRESQRGIDRELNILDRRRYSVVTCLDPEYPARLRMIPDPPPLLYVSGTMDARDHHAVAIVGSRHVTAAGRAITEELSHHLAGAGFTVVSGLARGVDAAAHRGALAAHGRTVAVLGCGIDRTYPPEHASLRERIEAGGAVVSELPVGAFPHSYHFPRRNRIISGMCLGVVVTEAAVQSGSLITARLAGEQGREVFAVPGSVKADNSRGPNGLIKQGAKLVEGAMDVIEELLPQLEPSVRARIQAHAPAPSAQAVGQPLDGNEAKVYAALSAEPTHLDAVIARAALPAADVTGLLLAMELKGSVRQLPGQSYIRI